MGRLRKELDLYADLRPIQSYPGVWCLQEKIDLIVIDYLQLIQGDGKSEIIASIGDGNIVVLK
jgi:isocitrate/isopropylmalate dehydrogenase